jgi:UDP-N-acetylglucosamine--N-acetylmuramyl-(pentapeptide) pyrophosphoryl-undecaprenol N-acetylglucosamine transferase
VHIIITGGGTGGHIFPALQIAEQFRVQDPTIQITYVGNENGPEKNLAHQHNLAFFGLNSHKIVGMGLRQKIKALAYLVVAIFESCKFLYKNKANAVIGVGGYVSAPMIIASFLLHIKRAICEQNVVPGMANKLLAKIANKIFISFPESATYFPAHKIILSGNPVREAFFAAKPKLFSKQSTKYILISGGSSGAQFLNTYVPQALALVQPEFPDLAITHQCGHKQVNEVAEFYEKNNLKAKVLSFIDNMPQAFAHHDIIISRAGATVCAEITASGMPAILVPYRFAQGHQKENALSLSKHQAGIILEESDNFTHELAEHLRVFLKRPDLLQDLSKHAKALAKPDAAQIIISTVLKECR